MIFILQKQFSYGTLNAGVIIRAFRTSNDSVYRTLWKKMRKTSSNAFTGTNEEGIEKARKDNFIFILPSTIGDYIAKRRPCDLVTKDRFLMNRAYALAVQKGSALLPKLNNILSLFELNGYLRKLYHKWWSETTECNGVKTSKRVYRTNETSVVESYLYIFISDVVSLRFIMHRVTCVYLFIAV